jgi:hypothetical protein
MMAAEPPLTVQKLAGIDGYVKGDVVVVGHNHHQRRPAPGAPAKSKTHGESGERSRVGMTRHEW